MTSNEHRRLQAMVDRRRSIEDMARILNCSTQEIWKKLKRYSIERHRKNWENNKKKLKALMEKHGSISAVAKVLGCSRQAVWDKLRRYQLEYDRDAYKVIKSKKSAEKASLVIRKVFLDNLTYPEVAEAIGCKPDNVSDLVHRYVSKPAKEILETRLRETCCANIRIHRMMSSMTQKGLAKKLGIQQSHLSDIERGEVGIHNDLLGKIAKVLNTKTSLLLHPIRYEEIAQKWKPR